MKNSYRLYQRKNGYFYSQDNTSGAQKSLGTKDLAEAEKLLNAENQARQTPALNLQLGKVYLTNADPNLSKRTWQDVMNELASRGIESTRNRKIREFRSKAYDGIRKKLLVETTGDDLRLVLKRGRVSTNCTLRILHNYALENGWIHWPLIPPAHWPKCEPKEKRGITQEEHEKIIASEMNEERRNYYQMLWEIGAAQTDCALLTAEKFNWKKRVLSYQRKKTGEWCHLGIGNTLEALTKKLPQEGFLFPKISTLKDKDRSAEFSRRCRLLNPPGLPPNQSGS